MRKNLLAIGALLAGLLLAVDGIAVDKLAILGTGDGVAVLKKVGAAYTEAGGVKVEVPRSIGSGGGVKAVGNDKALLGRVARGIKEKEEHFGLTYTPVFRVPTVFLVHQSVTVDGITAAQAVGIYSGKITNWKEVGGADKPINVVRREDDDSSLKNLRKSFPGFKDLAFPDGLRTAEKTPVMVTTIQNLEDAIGFGPLDVAIANGLKTLTIDGKAPMDQGYPTLGTIGLIYKEANYSGDVKKFVEFALSEAAHVAIREAGGLPIE